MTTAPNYGHRALSAIEAYILALETENRQLRRELEAMHRPHAYEGLESHEDARCDLGTPTVALYPGYQARLAAKLEEALRVSIAHKEREGLEPELK